VAELSRIEVWNRYVSQTGTRTVIVGTVLRCEGREGLDGSDAVEFDCPLADQAVASLVNRKIVRLVFSDATFSEWRISSVRGVHGEPGGVVTVIAHSPLLDLADGGIISEVGSTGVPNFDIGLVQVTIEDVVDDYIVPALALYGQGVFTKGTIEPTMLLDPQFSAETPLAWLRRLCDLARDPDTGRPAELRVRRNGTTGYLIDVLTEIGSDAAIADLRYKKNLRTTDRTKDSAAQATVVSVFGAPFPNGETSSIQHVAFRLGTPTGLTYPITDPETGQSPILEDAFASSYYVVPDAAGLGIAITSSAVGPPATITLASSTGITPGNVYELRQSPFGVYLTEMVSVANFATYGRKHATVSVPAHTGVYNMLANNNPWFRTWTTPTNAPDGWAVFAAQPFSDYMSQNTDALYTQYGGKSVRMHQESAVGPVFGLVSGTVYPEAITDSQFFSVKCRVLFSEFSGSAWFYLQVRPASGGDPIAALTLVSPNNLYEQGTSPAVGEWVDISIVNIDLGLWNAGVQVHIRAGAGAGFGAASAGVVDCYVDAVQMARHSGEAPEGYYEFSGANHLWAAGLRALRANGAPLAKYEVDLDDLTRFDGTAFPFDTLTTGGTIRLTDSALGVAETMRVIAKPLIDYLVPKRTQLTLATRAELLAEYLNSTIPQSGRLTPTTTKPGDTTPPPGTGIGAAPTRWEGNADGDGLIIENVPAALTEISRKFRRHVVLGAKHNVTVHVMDPKAGCKLVPMVWDGSDWDYLDGVGGPFAGVDPTTVAAATEDTVLGALAATATDYRGLQLCSWGTVGGDGAVDLELGTFALIGAALSDFAVPPSVPPDEIPTTMPLLLADWQVAEGSGSVSDDSTGNGHDLTLGPNLPDDQDPTWFGGTTRGLLFGAASGLHLKYAINQSLPYNAGELQAFSCVWYFRFSSVAAGPNAYIFRLTSTGGGELQIRLTATGTVQASRGTAGGPVVVESAVLSTDTDYMITYTNESASSGSAKLYVNAALVDTDTLPGLCEAFTTQPRFYWGADTEGFTSSDPMPAILGRTLLYDGVLTSLQVQTIYNVYKLDPYTGLP
jgi:hypothetical protein